MPGEGCRSEQGLLHALGTRGRKHPSTHTRPQTLPGANSTGNKGGGCSKLQGKLLGDAYLQVVWGAGCVWTLHPTAGALAKTALSCRVMGAVADLGAGRSWGPECRLDESQSSTSS